MNKRSLSIALTKDVQRHFWYKRIRGKHLLPLLDPLSLVAKERLWRENIPRQICIRHFVLCFLDQTKRKWFAEKHLSCGFQDENKKNVVVS